MYCRFHDVLINSINAKKIEGAIVMKMAVTRTDTQLVPFYNINYDIGPRLREATMPVWRNPSHLRLGFVRPLCSHVREY